MMATNQLFKFFFLFLLFISSCEDSSSNSIDKRIPGTAWASLSIGQDYIIFSDSLTGTMYRYGVNLDLNPYRFCHSQSNFTINNDCLIFENVKLFYHFDRFDFLVVDYKGYMAGDTTNVFVTPMRFSPIKKDSIMIDTCQ